MARIPRLHIRCVCYRSFATYYFNCFKYIVNTFIIIFFFNRLLARLFFFSLLILLSVDANKFDVILFNPTWSNVSSAACLVQQLLISDSAFQKFFVEIKIIEN